MMYRLLALGWLATAVLCGGALYILALVEKYGFVLLIEPSRPVLLTEIGLFTFDIAAALLITFICITRFIKERRGKKHDTRKTTTG